MTEIKDVLEYLDTQIKGITYHELNYITDKTEYEKSVSKKEAFEQVRRWILEKQKEAMK